MSSETSTDASGLQPWHFFVVVTMLAATAAVLVARETAFENLLLISLAVMSVGLVAVAAHRMLWPLTGDDDSDRPMSVGGRTRLALEREKMLVLRSIKELEFDRAMGKIADSDFQDMVGRLRARAIGLMKQLDQQDPDWASLIERELAQRLGVPGGAAARSSSSTPGPPRAHTACESCGTDNDGDARFCKNCGTPLTPST